MQLLFGHGSPLLKRRTLRGQHLLLLEGVGTVFDRHLGNRILEFNVRTG